jgi:SAM-dependent methyltransferase
MNRKSDNTTIDNTIESYRLSYIQNNDIWKNYKADYFNPATDFFINSFNKNSLILDQGCGTGYLILRHALAGHFIEGFDISPEAIELCRRRLVENNIDKSFFKLWVQDIREFDYPNECYNGIADYYTLHHFPKSLQKEIIKKIYQSLKPLGFFLLGMFSKDQFPENKQNNIIAENGYVSVSFKTGKRFFYLWEVHQLESFLESVGFRIILTYRGLKYHSCEIICQKPEKST